MCAGCGSAWSSSCPARGTGRRGAARFRESVDLLTGLGAEVVEVDCPHFEYALGAYYLILPSEASSNLAKFDAMRFGLRVGDDGSNGVEQVMSLTREAGFGAEVKRRIMLGTYALSAGYYDAYYGQAQKVRTLIARDFAAAFATCDVLLSPTFAHDGVPVGGEAGRPVGHVPQRRGHDPGEPGRYRGDVPASRAGAGGRVAGRAADHGAGPGR